MIIEFRVKNYRSIVEEQRLSFVASKDKRLSFVASKDKDKCIKTKGREEYKLLRANIVYGANDSGKTNLILALKTMRSLILNSDKLSEEQYIKHYTPFSLDETLKESPTSFEISLLIDNIRYQYGFAFDRNRIISEYLLAYEHARAQHWFEYYYDDAKSKTVWKPFSSFFCGTRKSRPTKIKNAKGDRCLFLTKMIASNNKKLLFLYNWFLNKLNIVTYTVELNDKELLKHLTKEKNKSLCIDIINSTGIDINDISIQNETGVVKFCHKITDEESKWFEPEFESSGVLKLFVLSLQFIDALKNGKLLILDTFDANLHSLILSHLLRVFENYELNLTNSQLWVNAYNTSLLTSASIRRDQIWFIDKNYKHHTELYSLLEFKPNKQEKVNLSYLTGRYGAVSFIDELPCKFCENMHNEVKLHKIAKELEKNIKKKQPIKKQPTEVKNLSKSEIIKEKKIRKERIELIEIEPVPDGFPLNCSTIPKKQWNNF